MALGKNRIVAPGSDRIGISDGDWIELKRELNTGDQKKLEVAGTKAPVIVDGKVVTPIDWGNYEIERALIFLTDWSLHGPEDKPLVISPDAIRALDIDTFNEINRAVIKHTLEGAAKKLKRMLELKELSSTGQQPTTKSETLDVPASAPTST